MCKKFDETLSFTVCCNFIWNQACEMVPSLKRKELWFYNMIKVTATINGFYLLQHLCQFLREWIWAFACSCWVCYKFLAEPCIELGSDFFYM